MLPGLMSRWTIETACAAARARVVSSMRVTRSRTLSGSRAWKASASETPESSSIARKRPPSSVSPASKMSMTLGWSMRAEIRASREKRRRAVTEVATCACMNLRANSRPVPAWIAFQTSPMPPMPSRTSSWYLPATSSPAFMREAAC